MMAQDYLEEIC